MKRVKSYKKIILFQVGVLATLVIHYFVTQDRGYKAIGGEFLLIPLLYILYLSGQAIKARWKETNEHFQKKDKVKVWQEEGRRDYAN